MELHENHLCQSLGYAFRISNRVTPLFPRNIQLKHPSVSFRMIYTETAPKPFGSSSFHRALGSLHAFGRIRVLNEIRCASRLSSSHQSPSHPRQRLVQPSCTSAAANCKSAFQTDNTMLPSCSRRQRKIPDERFLRCSNASSERGWRIRLDARRSTDAVTRSCVSTRVLAGLAT